MKLYEPQYFQPPLSLARGTAATLSLGTKGSSALSRFDKTCNDFVESISASLADLSMMDHISEVERGNCVEETLPQNTREWRSRNGHPPNRHTAQRAFSDSEAVHIQMQDLSVSVNTAASWLEPSTYPQLIAKKFNTTARFKTLLDPVSVELNAGTLTAIMGSSGSGKTTLLNTIAERATTSRLHQTGRIAFNGRLRVHSVRHAYVMQSDRLPPSLTVTETLRYAAELRLSRTIRKGDRRRAVDELINELGLKDCAFTRIGDGSRGGCSDGEMRRVSIAVQLLSDPSLLFLDEPTTGLDAASAFSVIQTLKKLARMGRTIIATIHQPRSEIWDLFDSLIILSGGTPVYCGPTSNCLPWFRSVGLELPPFVNAAEFVINICTINKGSPELERETRARVARLKTAWKATDEARPYAAGTMPIVRKKIQNYRATNLQQVRVVAERTFKATYRDPMGMGAAIFEAMFLGIFIGYLFYDLSRDAAGIKSRQGVLFAVTGLQGYLVLLFETYRLTIDLPAIDREFSDGCLDPLPFILGRRLARFPTEDVPVPLIFSAIVYFMVGFDHDAGKFCIFFAITLVNHYVAVLCAMACVTAARHFAGASLIANMVYTVQTLACGMFVQSNTIPVYVRWLKWLSYGFYIFGAYTTNEFQGMVYDCPHPVGGSASNCQAYVGDHILRSLGFPQDWLWRPVVVSFAFAIVFCIGSAMGLRLLPQKVDLAQARAFGTDTASGKEKMQAASVPRTRHTKLSLKHFSLQLEVKAFLARRPKTTPILRSITAAFPAGELNVVMGPSGGGKTSLLNALAFRLRGSFRARYRSTGSLMMNDAEVSASVLQSTMSYVTTEASLLPALTVRETLYFAAGLRLHSLMSKRERIQRAEDVLLKLGLLDCADNLIGNDIIKGVSGGEKRRVLIATQLMSDSSVLLLDEPTSGLDAFTANSIIKVLVGLASEGRTVITTIHQASADMFAKFDNVLLLSHDGRGVFSGPSRKMLGYFGKLGYRCPPSMNIADFVLDLLAADRHLEGVDTKSSPRVDELCHHWKEFQERDLGNQRQPSIDLETTTTHMEAAACEASARKPTSLVAALPLLLHRATLNLRRQPSLIMARIMQVVGLTIILTLFFAPLRHDSYSIQNRMGFVQQVGAFYFVGMLQNIAVYPFERDVFVQENRDGAYGPCAFLAAYSLLEVPFEIVSSLLFGVIGPLAIQLPQTPTVFFTSVWACFAIVSCGESAGIVFNTLFSHTGFAVSATGMALSVANAMGGILSIDMPALLRALNYLSPLRYAFRIVATYSLRGVHFTCNSDEARPDGRCYIETGEEVLSLYKLDEDPVVNIVGLATCVIFYRMISFAVLIVFIFLRRSSDAMR